VLDFLWEIDVKILYWLHVELKSSILDFIFPYLTDLHKVFFVKWFIAPLLLLFWYLKQKNKMLRVLGCLILLAGLSDQIGYRLLKPSFDRVRPNNEVRLQDWIRPLKSPQSGSFPSNHAMNTFAIFTTLIFIYPYLKWGLWPLAVLISLTRVYAGVHYPSDILGGALLGFLLAWVLMKGYKKFLNEKYPLS